MGRDRIRAAAVLVAAVAAPVAGAFGGSGAIGAPIGVVASEHPTAIMPATPAYAIWTVIYLAVLVLAVRQVLPGQPTREVHRETGWWLAGALAGEAAWVLLFSARLFAPAEVVLVTSLACLVVVTGRLARHPAAGAGDRWALHGPVALSLGWVAVATVVGTASTGEWLGVDGVGGLGTALGVVMLVVTGAIAGWVIDRGPAPVPFAAAVVWALAWIVLAGTVPIVAAAVVAITIVAVALVRRLLGGTSSSMPAAAFG